MAFWAKGVLQEIYKIVVVGAQTDALRKFAPDWIFMEGFVVQSNLEELLVRAKCLWVNQPPTTGQLMRIYEAILAGIPVVANRWAARGFETCAGVTIYDELDDVTGLLCLDNLDVPRSHRV